MKIKHPNGATMSEAKVADVKKTYEFWKQNPHLHLEELCRSQGLDKRDMNVYLKATGLPRADGRVIGKDSPRQKALRATYEVAIKLNETPGWAERYAFEKFGQKTNKGDYRYYTMKNDLPPLREVAATMQVSPSKKSI
jgi:hypothetical protein